MVCVDCGGTMTDDDAIWSPGIGVLTHINYSQCIASLNERLTAATQRAEAAEAERDVLAEKWGGMVDDNGDPLDASGILEYVCTLREELSHMQAERDALRKDAARYRWLKPQLEMDWDLGNPVYLSLGLTVEVPTYVEVSFDLDATIDAALAVQPLAGAT